MGKKWKWQLPLVRIEDGETVHPQEMEFVPMSGSRGLNSGTSNMSDEQIERDKKVTRLLEAYVCAYEKKFKHSTWCRYIILLPCMTIVAVFGGVLVWLCTQVVQAADGPEPGELAAFITACVSFLALIVGILHIVTEYFFPKDDEKYITEIVKSVQGNDLENRKESAQYSKDHPVRSGADSSPADLPDLQGAEIAPDTFDL